MALDTTTIDAVKDALRGENQSALAQRIGIAQGTISDVARGRAQHVSRQAENRLRVALGLEPIHRVEVDACPDCGSVHVGRCHGREVVLRPVRVRRLPERIADMPRGMLAALLRGETVTA